MGGRTHGYARSAASVFIYEYVYIYIYIYVCTYFIYLCVCFCSVINIATSDDTLNEVAAAYLREFP